MNRWLRNVVAICVMAIVLSAIGCRESIEANHADASRGHATSRVEANEEVTVLARSGARTFVQTADGAKGFVPSDRLRIDGSAGVVTEASELDVQTSMPEHSQARATEQKEPRPVAEINRERGQLDVLYLSEDGSREFLRPKSVGPFVDPESGQVCWPAVSCLNEDCAGLSAGNGRSAFPGMLFHIKVDADGAHKKGEMKPRSGLICPACGEKERLRPYVLPETATAMEQLAEEHRQRLAWERANR